MTSFSHAIPRPEYGPHQLGRDPAFEILAAVDDIESMHPADKPKHIEDLLSRYTAAQFVDALFCSRQGGYT